MSCSTSTIALTPGPLRGRDQGLHDAVLVGGGDAGGRLVEQDDLRIEREGGRNIEQLLLALRQCHGGDGVEPVAKPKDRLPPRECARGSRHRPRSRARAAASACFCRETTAAAMVSATVSCGKIWISWNARARPWSASATGPTPAMLRPMNSTSPAVGVSSPVSRLTSVVLPAPFGPTTETSSPGRNARCSRRRARGRRRTPC